MHCDHDVWLQLCISHFNTRCMYIVICEPYVWNPVRNHTDELMATLLDHAIFAVAADHSTAVSIDNVTPCARGMGMHKCSGTL